MCNPLTKPVRHYILKQLFYILFILTPALIFCQTKDTMYKYDICVHQKLKQGKVTSSSGVFLDDGNHTRLYIEIWDNNKTAIETAIITISSSKNDSVVKSVILTERNRYTVDELRQGSYNVKIQSIGYTSQKLTNVELINNKSVYLNFQLGQSDAFIQMTIKSNKKLSARQLKKRIAKTEKELNE